MKSATELLAEMLDIYEDPEKGIAGLGLWLHHEKDEVREVVEKNSGDSERLDWYEEHHYEGDEGSFRDSIDRARGEEE